MGVCSSFTFLWCCIGASLRWHLRWQLDLELLELQPRRTILTKAVTSVTGLPTHVQLPQAHSRMLLPVELIQTADVCVRGWPWPINWAFLRCKCTGGAFVINRSGRLVRHACLLNRKISPARLPAHIHPMVLDFDAKVSFPWQTIRETIRTSYDPYLDMRYGDRIWKKDVCRTCCKMNLKCK